jgi:hypothetical protein
MAINTSRVNKTKTVALAIINEEIEKMRAMDYGDIGLVGGDPEGTLNDAVNTEDGFLVSYAVSWADEGNNYKQVSVSAFKEPMVENLEVITRIYPSGNDEDIDLYPPPAELTIIDDFGQDDSRTIVLGWNAPQTEQVISEYRVYRNNIQVGTSYNITYTDYPGGNISYTYYVTAIYPDGTESGPSNECFSDEAVVEVTSGWNNTVVLSLEPSLNLLFNYKTINCFIKNT